MFQEASLRGRVKKYKKQLGMLAEHLEKTPKDWGRFQSEFNQEIDSIFREIMLFEKEQLQKGQDDITSMGAAAARCLKKYIRDGTEIKGQKCPSCGKDLVYLEGCCSCPSCGWSRCN